MVVVMTSSIPLSLLYFDGGSKEQELISERKYYQDGVSEKKDKEKYSNVDKNHVPEEVEGGKFQ